MKPTFGPWSTAMGTGNHPELSTFWKRRMTRLHQLKVTRPKSLVRDVLAAFAAGVPLFFVPTFHGAAHDVRASDPAKVSVEAASPKHTDEESTSEPLDAPSADELLTLIRTNFAQYKDFQVDFRTSWREAAKREPNRVVEGTWWYRRDGNERLRLLHTAGSQTGREEIYVHASNRLRSLVDIDLGGNSERKAGHVKASGWQWKVDYTGMPHSFVLHPRLIENADAMRATYRVDGWEEVDGHRCLKISHFISSRSVRDERGVRRIYWLDLERGGNALRYELKRGTGRDVLVAMSEVQLHEVSDGLWFPIRCRFDTFTKRTAAQAVRFQEGARKLGIKLIDPETGKEMNYKNGINLHQIGEVEIDPATIRLGQDFDDGMFGLSFPQGARVLDETQ